MSKKATNYPRGAKQEVGELAVNAFSQVKGVKFFNSR